MNKLFETLGRIVYAVPFAVFGLFHFMNAAQMTGMVPGYVPFKLFFVYFTGVALIAAFVFIAFKIKYANFVALGLALELLSFILMIHLPNMMSSNPQLMQMGMMSLLKDASLFGAALFFAGNLSEKK